MARSKFMARSKYNHHTMARSIEWVLLLHHRSIITQSMFSRLHVNAGPENLVWSSTWASKHPGIAPCRMRLLRYGATLPAGDE